MKSIGLMKYQDVGNFIQKLFGRKQKIIQSLLVIFQILHAQNFPQEGIC